MTKTRKVWMSCLMGIGALLASCSSGADEDMGRAGSGNIRFGVSSYTAFTRALNETDYTNTGNYTVEILQEEKVIESFLYKDRADSYSLPNGNYILKAFYGEEKAASRNEFHVEGTKSFSVEGNKGDAAVSVDCYPTCGKAAVIFADNMADFFSEYYVVYETEAVKAEGGNVTWGKDDTEPWYLKLNSKGETVKATIHLTRADNGTTSSMEKKYDMKPGKSWTMSIAAKDGSGGLGITITIDESTTDHVEDITVPSEWI